MHQGGGKVLIFVRTRNAADDLATLVMQRYGGRSDAIHGQRRQEQRETSLRHDGTHGRMEHLDVGQNGRPMWDHRCECLVEYSPSNLIGVPNFDPYPSGHGEMMEMDDLSGLMWGCS